MKGYKAFDKDLSCRGFQYEVGKTYEFDGELIVCSQGFHFCKSIAECYKYYPMADNIRICEVEALGDIVGDGNKYCTNKIRIDREVEEDWQRRGNTSANNTGYCNTSNGNTGNYNTGGYNVGNRNTGIRNMGDRNTGNHNTGDYNTGYFNTGYFNTGNYNAGNRNAGAWNTGDGNTGDCNMGSFNTGSFNIGDCNTGFFNTETSTLRFFDKESDWTVDQWVKSRQNELLNKIWNIIWVNNRNMTEEERKVYPEYEVIGGYLKVDKIDATEWWNSLTDEDRECFKELPNYDEEKFKKCMGLDGGLYDTDK